MTTVLLRFYEELNDYLPVDWRKRDVEMSFTAGRTIGHVLQSLNIPQAQVDLVLANGRSKGLDYVMQHKDRISVYPVFERLNIGGVTRVEGAPRREIRFIAEAGLGALAKALRIKGLDVRYTPHLSPREMAEISRNEHRILLTRRREFGRFGKLRHAMRVPRGRPEAQAAAVLRHLFVEVAE